MAAAGYDPNGSITGLAEPPPTAHAPARPGTLPGGTDPSGSPAGSISGATGGVAGESTGQSGTALQPGGQRGGNGQESDQPGSGSTPPEREPDLLDAAVDIASYATLDKFFADENPNGTQNGIPGAMGDLDIGRWGQVAYLGYAVVDTIATIVTLGELKAAVTGMRTAARMLAKAVRELGPVAGKAMREAAAAMASAASMLGGKLLKKQQAKDVLEESFEELLELTLELADDPELVARLNRVDEFDVGGYGQLGAEGSGAIGRRGDNLDSDEVFQNLALRERLGVSRKSRIARDNPAVALRPRLHRLIKNLKAKDLVGMSAEEILQHHLDQMRSFVPPDVLVIVERESMRYIARIGL